MIDSLLEWCLRHYWIKVLWSKLPSRCAFMQESECDNNYLRWTEVGVTIYTAPDEQEFVDVWVCPDCLNKMRRVSFNAGHSVTHLEDGTVRYSPSSISAPESEGE